MPLRPVVAAAAALTLQAALALPLRVRMMSPRQRRQRDLRTLILWGICPGINYNLWMLRIQASYPTMFIIICFFLMGYCYHILFVVVIAGKSVKKLSHPGTMLTSYQQNGKSAERVALALKRPYCKKKCKAGLSFKTVLGLVLAFWSLTKTAQDSLPLGHVSSWTLFVENCHV